MKRFHCTSLFRQLQSNNNDLQASSSIIFRSSTGVSGKSYFMHDFNLPLYSSIWYIKFKMDSESVIRAYQLYISCFQIIQ